MTYKYYAGIGSRETPLIVLKYMAEIARILETKGYTLRSGGAAGADSAFESGVTDSQYKEIYLPKPGFNKSISSLHIIKPWATKIAKQFHPNWPRVMSNEFAFQCMSRNTYQIHGYTPTSQKSEFVVCWTVGGQLKGGTAQAIRLAMDLGIPVYNLAVKKDRNSLKDLLFGEAA